MSRPARRRARCDAVLPQRFRCDLNGGGVQGVDGCDVVEAFLALEIEGRGVLLPGQEGDVGPVLEFGEWGRCGMVLGGAEAVLLVI